MPSFLLYNEDFVSHEYQFLYEQLKNYEYLVIIRNRFLQQCARINIVIMTVFFPNPRS